MDLILFSVALMLQAVRAGAWRTQSALYGEEIMQVFMRFFLLKGRSLVESAPRLDRAVARARRKEPPSNHWPNHRCSIKKLSSNEPSVTAGSRSSRLEPESGKVGR